MLSSVKNTISSYGIFIIAMLGWLAVTSLHAPSLLAADKPGTVKPLSSKALTNTTSAASSSQLTTSTGGIVEFASFTGRVSLSVDGVGTNSQIGIVEVEKPLGATVRAAYLMAASNFTRVIADGDVSIGSSAGPQTPVTWDTGVTRDLPGYPAFFHNVLANVTAIVQPVVDAAAPGRVPFTVTEANTWSIDGVVLAVVFDDPSMARDNTIILLFGGQLTTGDVFNIGLAQPIDLNDATSVADLGLGIGFSYQDTGQYSVIDVNGARLTTAAGGQDDGAGENGALLTVGGLDDSNLNPPFPNAPPVDYSSDDELYNLKPFLNDGDLLITVNTLNPSNDDDIFFAWFVTSAPAELREFITLTPLADSSNVGTNHTVTARVRDGRGNPLVGQEVRFRILSGPHAGTTGAMQTDNNGEATFTYLGSITGTDTIQAFSGDASRPEIESNLVTETWLIPTHQICIPQAYGLPGDSVWFPITISTDSCIGLAQFVVEYDSSVLKFSRAAAGAQLNGFTLLVQPDLPFDPSATGTNENVLIQLSNGAACFTGDQVEVATLYFAIRDDSPSGPSPLVVDSHRQHTYLTTENLTILSGDGLEFCNGEVVVAPLSTICISLPDTNRYGYLPQGDQQHADRVVYCFQGTCGDVAVKYQLFDIDFDGEVEIFLNGVKLLVAARTSNNRWSVTRRLILPDNLVDDSGYNYLVFDNRSNPPNQTPWGVRVIGLEYPFSLPYARALGLIPLGDQAHSDKVAYNFYGYPGDLYLVYQVYDIDDKFELSIFLNGTLIKQDLPTPDAKWSGTRVVFLKDVNVRDYECNLIVFDNTSNPPQKNTWGVRKVSISNCIPLPYAGAVGKIRNGDKNHVNAACFSFNGRPGDHVLTYEAYDIDFDTEVAVYLNGFHIHNEAITADEAWSTTRTLTLPDWLVYDYYTNEIVFDNTKNPPSLLNWGVRKLKVTVAPSVSAVLSDLRGAKVSGRGVSGESFLLDGNTEIPDRAETGELAVDPMTMDNALTLIAPDGELTIELPAPQRLDHLMLYPEENPQRVFSYRLEASVDGKSWITVLDKSAQWSQGVQFEPLSGPRARLLRLSGKAYLMDDKLAEDDELSETEERAYENLYKSIPQQAKPTAFAIRELALYRTEKMAEEQPPSTNQPTAFGLAQNYPNPFSLSTRQSGNEQAHTMIRYELPQAEHVTITIYDALGRHVRTLEDGMQPAGSHHVFWNGRDNAGRPVAVGLYIYRMKAGNFVTQRTMVLTK
jgi:hypothetical protein